jgi:hypothetical protein
MRIVRNEAGVCDNLGDGYEATVGTEGGESRGDVWWCGRGGGATIVGSTDEDG